MPEKKFELGDYIEVKDRLARFYELFGKGSIVTEEVTLTTEPDGKPRVMVRAAAYRTPDDAHPGIGYSWLELPGSTPYTRGSELENAETSAWGRAIASLGILVDRSIASAQEVANKQDGEPFISPDYKAPPPPNVETEELMADTPKRSGMVRLGGAAGYKLEARQGPTGHVIGFRFETDKGEVPQVLVEGPAGEALYLATSQVPESMKDTRIAVKGRLYAVKKPGRKSYTRLRVTDWEWGDWKFPAEDEPVLPEPPEDVVLASEAETAPLFDDVA